MRRLTVLGSLLLVFAGGCTSGGDTGTAATPSVAESTPEVPTTTRTTTTPRLTTTTPAAAAPKVGLQTACTLYLADDLPTRSLEPITQFVANPDGSTIDLLETKAVVLELLSLAARSPTELGVQLASMAGVLQSIVIAYESGVNRTIKTGDFKAASIEAIFLCGEAIGD